MAKVQEKHERLEKIPYSTEIQTDTIQIKHQLTRYDVYIPKKINKNVSCAGWRTKPSKPRKGSVITPMSSVIGQTPTGQSHGVHPPQLPSLRVTNESKPGTNARARKLSSSAQDREEDEGTGVESDWKAEGGSRDGVFAQPTFLPARSTPHWASQFELGAQVMPACLASESLDDSHLIQCFFIYVEASFFTRRESRPSRADGSSAATAAWTAGSPGAAA